MDIQEQDIWDNMTEHCDDYYRLIKRNDMFLSGKNIKKRQLLDGLEKMVNSSYEDENITEEERDYLINYIND